MKQTKRAQRKLPAAAVVIELYLSGISAQQIGKMFQCSSTTVRTLLKANNCPIPRPRSRQCKEPGCDKPVYRVCRDNPSRSYFSSRCEQHDLESRRVAARAYARRHGLHPTCHASGGHKLRGRKRSTAFKQKVIEGQKRRQARGQHVGRPRKKGYYYFHCENCGVLVCDKKGNEKRVSCKKCRAIVAAKHRRKLPQDGSIAALYLEGLTTTELAKRFNSNPKSVRQELERAGVVRRRGGYREHTECKLQHCHKPIHKIWHSVHGKFYGTLCEEHFYQKRKEYSKRRWLKLKAQRQQANSN